MLQIIDQTSPLAPLTDRPRAQSLQDRSARSLAQYEVSKGADPFGITGENRLGFGAETVNGFTITGCDAHAAVRMHATPAIDSPWSFDRKGKYVASTPSAWELRSS